MTACTLSPPPESVVLVEDESFVDGGDESAVHVQE